MLLLVWSFCSSFFLWFSGKAKMAIIPGLAFGVVLMVLLLILVRASCGRLLFRLYPTDKAKRIEETDGDVNDPSGHAAVAAAKPQLNRLVSSGIANHQKVEHQKLDADVESAFLDTRSRQNNDPSAGFDESTPLRTWVTYYMSLGVRTFTLLLFVAYLPICVKVFQLFNVSQRDGGKGREEHGLYDSNRQC